VGAGEGEVVMCVGGSSSRQTALTDAKPVDLSIIAIIDSVELKGEKIFEKFKNERRPE
jgi:microcompartment protein CcmK/EutM